MSQVDKPLHERIIDWAVQTEETGDSFGIVMCDSEEWNAMQRCRGYNTVGMTSLGAANCGGYAVLVLLMIAAIAEAGDLP